MSMINQVEDSISVKVNTIEMNTENIIKINKMIKTRLSLVDEFIELKTKDRKCAAKYIIDNSVNENEIIVSQYIAQKLSINENEYVLLKKMVSKKLYDIELSISYTSNDKIIPEIENNYLDKIKKFLLEYMTSIPIHNNYILELEDVIIEIKTNIDDDEYGILIPETNIRINEIKKDTKKIKKMKKISFEEIGGLNNIIKKIEQIISLPLKHPELLEENGIKPIKGILLYGPPGTGKTLIAKAISDNFNLSFYSIKGPEILNKYFGQSEENLRNIFNIAKRNAPSIIFIDEIDSIAAKRENSEHDIEQRIVAQLLSLMDGIEERGKVIIVAATNQINNIDEALRRPGRFDREFEIPIPDQKGRREIFNIYTKNLSLASDVNLDYFSDITHGFTGADIESLIKEAAYIAINKQIEKINNGNKIKIEITKNDIETAMKTVIPSAIRELAISVPKETWDDIGGMDDVKEKLQQLIEWPRKYPKLYSRMNMKDTIGNGILLYGPPGTGKTLIAKILAHEINANFISVKGPEILNKYVGETERTIRKIFTKARQLSPCIIFFDEIDSISSRDTQLLSQLLVEIDGIEKLKDVYLIAATNRINHIDPALLRSGRFGIHLEIGLPSVENIEKILKIHLKNKPLNSNIRLNELAIKFDGLSGADIATICKDATDIAIKKYIVKNKRDITDAENIEITNDDLITAYNNLTTINTKKQQLYKMKKDDEFYS